MAAELVCAIHQPNLFPRLSTLAKLFAADVWIVLDDVQFTRRDYQHRCRLAPLDDVADQQWLTLPVHLPNGRATLIRDVRIPDPRNRRRTDRLIRQHYRRSPHWNAVAEPLDEVLDLLACTDHLTDIAQASTHALLRLLGWPGRIHRPRSAPFAHRGRCERLADLAHSVGASTYLYGAGGAHYLTPEPFTDRNVRAELFTIPDQETAAIWAAARRVTTLRTLATFGAAALTRELHRRAAHIDTALTVTRHHHTASSPTLQRSGPSP